MSAASEIDQARELTVLAWRRTLLRGVVIAVVAARVFTDEVGLVLIVVAAVVIAGAAVLNLAASRAYSDISTGSGVPAPKVPSQLRRPTLRMGIATAAPLVLGCVALWWVLAR